MPAVLARICFEPANPAALLDRVKTEDRLTVSNIHAHFVLREEITKCRMHMHLSMPGAAWVSEGKPVSRAQCSASFLIRPRPARRRPRCRAMSSGGTPADADDPLLGKVLEYGEALARSQEQSFLAAQDELRQQKEQREQAQAEQEAADQQDAADAVAGAAATSADAAAFVAGASLTATAGGAAAADAASSVTAQPAAGEELPGAASAGASFADAVREKLARAAQYRKEKQEAQELAEERGDDSSSEDSGGGGGRRARSGSEGLAAGFLANVMSNPTTGGFSKNQSAGMGCRGLLDACASLGASFVRCRQAPALILH